MNRFMLGIILLFPLLAFGQVEVVEVESEGTGPTLAIAINEALMLAVEQHQGKKVGRASIMADTDLKIQASFGDNYFQSPTYMDLVYSKSSGAVSGYEILSKTEDEPGVWSVTLKAKLSRYQPDPSTKRTRIAVLDPRSDVGSYAISGRSIPASQIADALNQRLTNRLTQANKFAVLDRKFDSDASAERAMLQSGDAPLVETSRLGQQLGADYLLVSKVTNFRYSETMHETRATGRKYSTYGGKAALDYRLVNPATQQILSSDTVTTQLSPESSMTTSEVVSYLSDGLAAKVVDRVVNQIYPIMLLSSANGNLVFSQGQGQLSPGDRFKLYSYGDELIDPYTNESLGRTEQYRGIVEIVRVAPNFSYGRPADAGLEGSINLDVEQYVLRERIDLLNPGVESDQEIQELIEAKKKKKKSKEEEW
ncbi:CsgG/HfaB family protein [Congregibacter variabilis]|uniref:CsgG/HfaB family protein n=1 Tax=Congregibacter variabilis TaxID=3081200 RepID=A0ABZ0I3S6_9GAMM|nr:CsgG/HfaB family protein [Congregibacter sp. IMCC43200]